MRTNRRQFLAASVIAARLATSAEAATSATGLAASEGDPSPLEATPPPESLVARGTIAKLQGVDIWYWDTGGSGKPAIVLLHPATGSGEVWGHQADAFAAAGFRVIGYSRRGFSGSGRGDPASPGTASDDLRMLLDHLRIRRCHTVGTAAGAFVAASFAVSWPDRVASLCLACSLLAPSDRAVAQRAAALRGPWYESLPHDVRELSPSYRMINRAGVERWNELHERSRGNNPPHNQPIGKPVTIDGIASLGLPVLLISGGADLISPPPVARAQHRAIKGSKLIVIPECGHSAYWERPDVFNAALLAFLRRQST